MYTKEDKSCFMRILFDILCNPAFSFSRIVIINLLHQIIQFTCEVFIITNFDYGLRVIPKRWGGGGSPCHTCPLGRAFRHKFVTKKIGAFVYFHRIVWVFDKRRRNGRQWAFGYECFVNENTFCGLLDYFYYKKANPSFFICEEPTKSLYSWIALKYF